MKVDMGYKFKTFDGSAIRDMEIAKDKDGNPIMNEDGSPMLIHGPPITMRAACCGVLANPPRNRDPRTGQLEEFDEVDKLMWGHLAMTIHKATEPVNLESEEISTLKRFIAKRYNNTLLVQQAFECLDPGCTEKARKEGGKRKLR